jgi:hypothetical protein
VGHSVPYTLALTCRSEIGLKSPEGHVNLKLSNAGRWELRYRATLSLASVDSG